MMMKCKLETYRVVMMRSSAQIDKRRCCCCCCCCWWCFVNELDRSRRAGICVPLGTTGAPAPRPIRLNEYSYTFNPRRASADRDVITPRVLAALSLAHMCCSRCPVADAELLCYLLLLQPTVSESKISACKSPPFASLLCVLQSQN